MIALDVSVLIGYLDATDVHHESATSLLTREIDEDLAANILTVAEILVAPTRTGQAEMVLTSLTTWRSRRCNCLRGRVALAQLHAETQLKMPDCCVLLTAREQQARLASFDERVVPAVRALGIDVAHP